MGGLRVLMLSFGLSVAGAEAYWPHASEACVLSTLRDSVLTLTFCFKRYSHSRQKLNKCRKEHRLSHRKDPHRGKADQALQTLSGAVLAELQQVCGQPLLSMSCSLSSLLRLSWNREDIVGH